MTLTGAQRRGLSLPLILDLLQPRKVPKPGVVVFVELGLPDLVFHEREIGAMPPLRAMPFSTADAVVTKSAVL